VPTSPYKVSFAGRIALAIAGLLLASTAIPTVADQVYKSVDAQGHVTYSDRPTTAGAQKTDVVVQQADPREAQRLAKERMLLKAEDDQRTKKTAADEQAKAKQDSQKKQLCDNARRHYDGMKEANRIYTVTADGNREYYTDAQAEAMRTEAKRAMDAACRP
jgi:uncharacterized protein DUF4124